MGGSRGRALKCSHPLRPSVFWGRALTNNSLISGRLSVFLTPLLPPRPTRWSAAVSPPPPPTFPALSFFCLLSFSPLRLKNSDVPLALTRTSLPIRLSSGPFREQSLSPSVLFFLALLSFGLQKLSRFRAL